MRRIILTVDVPDDSALDGHELLKLMRSVDGRSIGRIDYEEIRRDATGMGGILIGHEFAQRIGVYDTLIHLHDAAHDTPEDPRDDH